MNSTLSPISPEVGIFTSEKITSFGLGLGMVASVGLLLLITILALVSYYCTRINTTPLPPRTRHSRAVSATAADIESGINEATLMTYPRFLYSKAKPTSAASGVCCSICLGDYKDGEELRQLPDCGHVFHVKCVDPWLRLRPTCPLCRTSRC